jgi:hypothetical protein
MFLLDSLMISGIQWAIKTVITAAEAEMNDDSALREQLLEAEMRREMGEISDDEFGEIEADLLSRIREIKQRREGSGPLAAAGTEAIETTADSTFHVEASVSGDFYDPAAAPHTTVVETGASSGRDVRVLDMEPGDATRPSEPGLPLSREAIPANTKRRTRQAPGTSRTTRTARTIRTPPPSRRKRP